MLEKLDSREGVTALVNSAKGQERAFYEHTLETFDFPAYADIEERHGASDKAFADYLSIGYKNAVRMRLNTRSPMKILDLACGRNFFGLACRFFGHSVVGIDQAELYLLEISRLMGVEFIGGGIRAGELLPPTPRCDFVSALRASFHKRNKKDATMWTLDDWRFLLLDLRENHLTPKGQMFFILNSISNVPGIHVDDPEFIEFIRNEQGGMVDKHCVLIG
ncbi:MAG: class I SAM-dependent methyltransferase [Alphaproteobacteria bacterium]|nr:class I SAM-dependent methyltransferase [Alphaproteobacteria bacterium]